MGDSDAVGPPLSRRRRATFAAGRGKSVQPVNGRSAAACQSPVTVGAAGAGGASMVGSGGSPEAKTEKTRRKNDMSERLRSVRDTSRRLPGEGRVFGGEVAHVGDTVKVTVWCTWCLLTLVRVKGHRNGLKNLIVCQCSTCIHTFSHVDHSKTSTMTKLIFMDNLICLFLEK